MFGPKMLPAAGEVAAFEARLLAEAGVTPEDLGRGRGETEGARRPYRVKLGEPVLRAEGPDLILEVTLPRGSYATGVLDELVGP
jgi:tRNA pseudouridine13 synthase